ncbi:MAG: TadE/TadG family type IV pilus assembly protein [Rhizobiaceae bacterium]
MTSGKGDRRGLGRLRDFALRCAARLRRDERGSTAIEFTALAIPFSLLVFAILESCISFAGQELMTNAADDIARQLRTGQIKASGFDETTLKGLLCDRLEIMVSDGCVDDIEVDLKQYATFAAAAAVRIKLTSDKDIDTTGFSVSPGPSMSKNMLRVFYRWPVITDFMRKSMSNLKDGKTLHFATVTWQNEPFDD